MPPMPRLIPIIGLAMAILGARPVAAASDISDDFRQYYRQHVVSDAEPNTLGFLLDAAKAGTSAEQVLKPSKTRSVIVDRRNGYLQIDDSSDTDQILTMALYTKADGSSLLVVGSADCADACIYLVQSFIAAGEQLQPVARDAVFPSIAPAAFIKPGHTTPKALAALTPTINYVPARVGTSLTLTPWYGYEVEEQMNRDTRNAIRNIVLTWDGKQGRFVSDAR